MKKLLAMTVALGLVASFGLTACGGKKGDNTGGGAAKKCVTETAAKANKDEATCTAAHGKFTAGANNDASKNTCTCAE